MSTKRILACNHCVFLSLFFGFYLCPLQIVPPFGLPPQKSPHTRRCCWALSPILYGCWWSTDIFPWLPYSDYLTRPSFKREGGSLWLCWYICSCPSISKYYQHNDRHRHRQHCHHQHCHHQHCHHQHHYELIAIAGCMGKSMAPRVSGLHGKTHGMGKPMDIVMGKPMAQNSESFNGGGRHRWKSSQISSLIFWRFIHHIWWIQLNKYAGVKRKVAKLTFYTKIWCQK